MASRKTSVLSSFIAPREVGLNRDTNLLKLIAMISMLIDHVGKMFFPQYRIMRIIGRLAFPLFGYCVAVGCVYSRNRLKYLTRILLVGLISQPFYAVALAHTTKAMYAIRFADNPVGAVLNFYVQSWYTPNIMYTLALALMVIGFGIRLLFFKSCCRRNASGYTTFSRDGKDIRHIDSSFGKQHLFFAGEKFDGADVNVSFGGLTLDLRGAEIAKEAVIDLSVAFSGIVIIVPEGTAVVTAVSNGFGGVSDKRFSKINTGEPTLVLTGDIGFGGVELRN